VRKKNGKNYEQMSLFSSRSENLPLREAIEFYKHGRGFFNAEIPPARLRMLSSLDDKGNGRLRWQSGA
jgi:hypothetical protein